MLLPTKLIVLSCFLSFFYCLTVNMESEGVTPVKYLDKIFFGQPKVPGCQPDGQPRFPPILTHLYTLFSSIRIFQVPESHKCAQRRTLIMINICTKLPRCHHFASVRDRPWSTVAACVFTVCACSAHMVHVQLVRSILLETRTRTLSFRRGLRTSLKQIRTEHLALKTRPHTVRAEDVKTFCWNEKREN